MTKVFSRDRLPSSWLYIYLVFSVYRPIILIEVNCHCFELTVLVGLTQSSDILGFVVSFSHHISHP